MKRSAAYEWLAGQGLPGHIGEMTRDQALALIERVEKDRFHY